MGLNIDWGAIATLFAAFIASATALYISNQWNNQKGREVVADESKHAIKDLLELIKIAYFIRASEYNILEYESNFNRFKGLAETISLSILYLDDSVDMKNLAISYQHLFSVVDRIIALKNSDHWNDQHPEFLAEIDLTVEQLKTEAMNVINILGPYSAYRVEFKFKY
ncbi:hypothetical protein [Acinetobacter larvae]|uniref:DUF4760 domain-containing protein n=1 Tax=Acinetobacter larvae TaxID=1789224 RepID=A0A1B2LXH4_9GAMM|nr:hypothetical protein [Acinetobacter larvae]AOA57589.1 hypothetical protein BFG52_03950 [Acinetobacter larvae]